jgi:phage tail-like protein
MTHTAPKTLPESRYLDHLPAVMREPAAGDAGQGVLGQFLRAFEDVLSGRADAATPGLAEIIRGIAPDSLTRQQGLAGLSRYAEPGPELDENFRAPKQFLAWLAGWVALSLRADLAEQQQRQFIAQAISLYRLRGTRRGLERMLQIYTGLGVTISELATGLCVGKTATIGKDTRLEGGGPHFFRVTLRVPPPLPPLDELAGFRRTAIEIIEAEKPAHCFYDLVIIAPSLQIGVTSHVGVDTLLSAAPTDSTSASTGQRRNQ